MAHVAISFSCFMNRLLLIIHFRHTPGTLDNDFFDDTRSPGVILNKMVERRISVSAVIANPCLPTPKIAMDIHRTLSNEAVNQGFHDIVKELGQIENIASAEDPLQDVPEINPVYSHPVCFAFLKELLHSKKKNIYRNLL